MSLLRLAGLWAKQRPRSLIAGVIFVFICFYASTHDVASRPSFDQLPTRMQSWKATGPKWEPSEHGVLISSVPGWHADVWIGVAAVLERMGVETELYTECKGFNFAYGVGDTCVRYKLPKIAYEKGIWTKRGYSSSFRD